MDPSNELLIIALVLGAAHAGGWAFGHLGLPRGLGELLGGLLIGPSGLGALFPILPAPLGTPLLAGLETIGLAFLMFMTGCEALAPRARGEFRQMVGISLWATVLPLALAVLTFHLLPPESLGLEAWRGPRGSTGSFELLLATAVAVTSVPILSRILKDLDLLGTGFARMALGVAVLGNLPVYAVDAIALGLARGTAEQEALKTIASATLPVIGALLALFLVTPRAGCALNRLEAILGGDSAPILPWLLLFGVTGGGLALGVPVLLGAFLAGTWTTAGRGRQAPGLEAIRVTADRWLVPLWFGLIGAKLDLIHHAPGLVLVGFLLAAVLLKGGLSWIAARRVERDALRATDLALALNARGGPGLVIAAVGFEAGILSIAGKAGLVLLALLTSLLAGWWLARARRAGRLAD